ncbi:MAG TPA: hypothetical protein VFQ35_15335 [Polyangiaceae bacterium]|nr:hypothetical protein [Polyangiaceae bacterium]
MSTTPEPLTETLALILKEGRRRLLALTGAFAFIAIVALPIGLNLPKRWDASTLILAEHSNIIQPLMQGAAVPTDVTDQVAILNQIMARHRIMREVATFGGWLDGKQSRADEERVINKVKARIKVDSPRPEMVRISYYDTDPVKAAKVANKLAEIYVREGTAAKERESKEAFDFIDKRVTEYAIKLTEAHQAVIARYREQNKPAAAPVASAAGSAAAARPQVVAGAPRPAAPAPAPVRRPPPVSPEARRIEEQLSTRVGQLQNELSRLLSNYTEQHPDVVRVRRDLAAAQAELRSAVDARMATERAAVEAAAGEDEVILAARAAVQRSGGPVLPRAATGVPGTPGAVPGAYDPLNPMAAQDPTLRVVNQDVTLGELLNRYEATRAVYQDLLKRRENARVSMDLDAEHRGLSLRVQEPAEVPATASSMRLLHLCLIGLVTAIAVPCGLLIALVKMDGRLRTERQIERFTKLPVLTTIPRAETPKTVSKDRFRTVLAAAMVAGVLAVYLVTMIVRVRS